MRVIRGAEISALTPQHGVRMQVCCSRGAVKDFRCRLGRAAVVGMLYSSALHAAPSPASCDRGGAMPLVLAGVGVGSCGRERTVVYSGRRPGPAPCPLCS